MVRRKVELKPIEENSKRHTTFTKRRQGLFKKTIEFCSKFEAEAASIAISKAGNVYCFGHPHFDTILTRYLSDPSSSVGEENPPSAAQLTAETQKIITDAIGKGRPALELAMGNLGFKELDELEAVLGSVKDDVVALKREREK